MDFKLTEGANSGIKYSVHFFSPRVLGPGTVLGPEYQLPDDQKHPDAKARDSKRKPGSIYDILPSGTGDGLNPVGEWNTAGIVSKGDHVEHWLNGVKILEDDKVSDIYKNAFALSKLKDAQGYGESSAGHRLLQEHGSRVFFENIRIRKL